jgi:hypothetical protein
MERHPSFPSAVWSCIRRSTKRRKEKCSTKRRKEKKVPRQTTAQDILCSCCQHSRTRYIVGVLLLSSTALQRQTTEPRPENDRRRLRAMPPATGLVASGSDKVLKTNLGLRGSDQHLSHVRISNVCAGRAPLAKPRLQSAFSIVASGPNLM